MVTTFIALAILMASTLLVLGNLRMVALDTIDAVSAYARRAQRDGQMTRHIAYFALWLMIFVMSYM
jgi:esterase/lipase superfamily enzyme